MIKRKANCSRESFKIILYERSLKLLCPDPRNFSRCFSGEFIERVPVNRHFGTIFTRLWAVMTSESMNSTRDGKDPLAGLQPIVSSNSTIFRLASARAASIT